MNQHQRRIYDLAAELGDLQVRKRQFEEQLELVNKAIEEKHHDIAAAMRLRARAQEGASNAPTPTSSGDAGADASATRELV